MSDRIIVSALDMVELNLLRAYAPLRRELERAIVVSSALVPADVATMNSRVRYMDEKDGARRTVSLVYPSEDSVTPPFRELRNDQRTAR